MNDAAANTAGIAAVCFLLAAVLTVPVSYILLWHYQRTMAAAMRRHGASVAASADGSAAPPQQLDAASAPESETPQASESAPLAAALPHEGRGCTLQLEHIDPARPPSLPPAAEPVVHRLRQNPWLVALVYGVAGLVQAAISGIGYMVAGDLEVLPWRTVVVVWVYAWPIVLTTNLVAARHLRMQAACVAAYFALLLVMPPRLWIGALSLWGLTAVVPTFLLLIFLHSRLRPVGPLVFAFMFNAAVGSQLALLIGATTPVLNVLVPIMLALNLGVDLLPTAVPLAGFALFSLLGWLVVGWIRRRYERKQISDESIVADTIWLIFATSVALVLFSAGEVGGAAVTMGSFVVYKILTLIGFAILRRGPGDRPNHRLLLLRVFGSRQRSERLMNLVGARWRHAGSIHLIAGTDLAVSNVQPQEFLDFVSGRLTKRYVQNRDVLERHVANLDVHPDIDGRYRVSQFFCYDDTWQMTLRRIVQHGDAVLMDLRGFSPTNRGCVFELHELIDTVPLDRVVLVVDKTTDEPFLHQILDEASAQAAPTSPNCHGSPCRLTICRLDRVDAAGAKCLLACLARAVVHHEDTPAPRMPPASVPA